MDRIEPKGLEPDLASLTFRRPPRWTEPVSDSRFSIAIGIFLLVALVYPWYSYWVQTHLLARDLQQGMEEFSAQLEGETRQDLARVAEQGRIASEHAARRRIAAVRVLGVSDSNPPLAVVDLGSSSMLEADATICRQTGLWLHESVSGKVIRVQRADYRGTDSPFLELTCP